MYIYVFIYMCEGVRGVGGQVVDVDMGVDVDVGVGVDWFFVCLLFMDEFSIFTLTPQK